MKKGYDYSKFKILGDYYPYLREKFENNNFTLNFGSNDFQGADKKQTKNCGLRVKGSFRNLLPSNYEYK